MTPRRRTSRKRSAASSSAKRLEPAVFYLDESIYSRISEELERAGMSVRRPGVDVPFGIPDATSLATAGTEGWIVLMRDQRVRHRALEIQTLRDAKVGAFVLTAGQATARDKGCWPERAKWYGIDRQLPDFMGLRNPLRFRKVIHRKPLLLARLG